MHDWIGATTAYWQAILPADAPVVAPPYRYAYPARLPDGRVLELPLRRVPGSADQAVASLIANQASLTVQAELAAMMGALARPLGATLVVGLPTLGLAFAPGVAQALGHPHYVPLGYSRKYWYDDALAVPVRSLTTPGAGKTLYLDPNMLDRLAGARVVIVDDAVSTGQTAAAAIELLTPILAARGGNIAGMVVAMLQGEAWRTRLAEIDSRWPDKVMGVLRSPRLRWAGAGWLPI